YAYKTREILLREYRRNKTMVHAVAAAGVVLVAVTAFSYLQILASRNQAIAAQQQTEAEKYVATLHLVEQYINTNQMDLARRTLLTLDEGRRGWEWGFLLGRCNQELASLSDRVG